MLTRQDYDVLIEATEAWENKDDAGQMVGGLLSAMFSRDDPLLKEKMEMEQRKQKSEYEQKKNVRKERSIVLRAKLIQMRDSVDADSFLAEAAK